MSKQVRVFNIQKFSIHDGPGIRTTVFFKGCPLRCPWCANPESQSPEIQLTWDHKKCINCRRCESVGMTFGDSYYYPHKNLAGYYMKLKTVDSVEEAKKIMAVCPTGAINYEGKDMTLDEIMEAILDDKDFYDESGGGVTLSGGEVLMQADLAIELMERCKTEGIQTAAETTCLAPKEVFKRFIEPLDILLCDIKHWDSEFHKNVIGAPLHLIHENIKMATKKEGLRVIGRIPVIPKFNFSMEDAKQFVRLLREFGIEEVNLLPFHNMGENKYELLNWHYPFEHEKNLRNDSEEFKQYEAVFKAAGLIKDQ